MDDRPDSLTPEHDPSWQTCYRCGRRQRFEFSVTDKLWALVPVPYCYHALCIECFLLSLDERGEPLTIGLDDFVFVAVLGGYINSAILVDWTERKE